MSLLSLVRADGTSATLIRRTQRRARRVRESGSRTQVMPKRTHQLSPQRRCIRSVAV